jgi:hypothetical protein
VRVEAIVVVAVGLLPVATAYAANGMRPRTPAQFPETPCLQTVDASVEPTLHLSYAVPYDDTMLTADEVADSRTQQFFAFAHQSFDFAWPRWITEADLARARDNGDVTEEQHTGTEDVLETASDWPEGTFVRITPDDPRLPITIARAMEGVDWDLTDVADGAWVVAAYTWEPEQNLWSLRPGVVRIHHGDPDAAGPAAFLPVPAPLNPVNTFAPFDLPLCAAAPADSTIAVAWGHMAGSVEPTWVPIEGEQTVPEGEGDLEVVLPAEAEGSVLFRVEITDPAGRSTVAFRPYAQIVFAGQDPGDTPQGCRMGQPPVGGPALMVLLLGGLRRRRARNHRGAAAYAAGEVDP